MQKQSINLLILTLTAIALSNSCTQPAVPDSSMMNQNDPGEDSGAIEGRDSGGEGTPRADAGQSCDAGIGNGCPPVLPAAPIVFPDNAGVIDVSKPPYNAMPNDASDDTAAVQKALDEHPTGNHIFYFPQGTYLFSATLKPALSSGVVKRNIFQGAGKDLTVLKYKDGLALTGAVIDFGGGPAQLFRNSVRDLTIDIGTGNPGASALKFNASNQGTVANVRLRAPAGEGNVGLDLSHSGEIGPLLVRDVQIESFALGIWTRFQTASQTFENVAMSGQREAGWLNSSVQAVFARNLISTNSVPAIVNGPLNGRDSTGEGLVVLTQATLKNTGNTGGPAIRNQKSMFLQAVNAEGYDRIVTRDLTAFRGNETDVVSFLGEYWANGQTTDRRGGAVSAFGGPDTTLGLEVLETPEVAWSPLNAWASPLQFGGVPSDGVDDTAAIQKAIDSGAETVYLPRGTWQLEGALMVRGSVKRLMGTEATLLTKSGTAAVIRVEDGTANPVVLERFEQPSGSNVSIEHASARTLVIQDALVSAYSPIVPAPGDVFFRDVVMGRITVRNQRAWARQLNLEGSPAAQGLPRVLNDNAKFWILGMKTEDNGTDVRTISGGVTELYGAPHVGSVGTATRFETVDASLVAVGVRGGVRTATESRGGMTRTVDLGLADFYTAFDAAVTEKVGSVVVDNSDATRFSTTGTWTATTAFPGGFVGADALFTKDANATATYAATLQTGGTYKVFARWMVDRSGQNHSGHSGTVDYEITHAGGTAKVTVSQKKNGGDFISLGTFSFSAAMPARVVVKGSAAGVVLADAVRWQRK
jgi:Pectate lyase superfamily protein